MSFSWLIDGYNLMGALGLIQGKLGRSGLEKGRIHVLDLLATHFGDQAGEVLVIFDAAKAPKGFPAEMEHRGIQVRFAKAVAEADDLIEELLKKAPRPSNLVLVSSDHRLRRAAELNRQQVMDCHAFLDELERRSKHPRPGPTSATADQENAKPPLTEVEHWLTVFADLDKDKRTRELFDDYGLGRDRE